MRFFHILASLTVCATLAGCGDSTPPAKDPSNTSGESGGGGGTAGAPAAAFSVASLNGGGTMSVQPGKVMIVDFWATWCEPCKKSFPKLQELYTKYKASGLEIAAISEDDDKSGIADFVKTYGAKFPVGWDADKSVAKKWQPKSMPSTFIVDKKGIVKFVHTGYHDGEEAEIEKEIKSLLGP